MSEFLIFYKHYVFLINSSNAYSSKDQHEYITRHQYTTIIANTQTVDTVRDDVKPKILTSLENTAMKENNSGGCLLGSLYKIPIPSVMNGVEKSIPRWRSAVIVKSQIAKSAFCKQIHN